MEISFSQIVNLSNLEDGKAYLSIDDFTINLHSGKNGGIAHSFAFTQDSPVEFRVTYGSRTLEVKFRVVNERGRRELMYFFGYIDSKNLNTPYISPWLLPDDGIFEIDLSKSSYQPGECFAEGMRR